jgi:hypothetical protein
MSPISLVVMACYRAEFVGQVPDLPVANKKFWQVGDLPHGGPKNISD